MRNKISLFLLGLMLLLPAKGFSQVVNPTEAYTYEKLTEDLDKIKRDYPQEVSITKLGMTQLGRTVWGAKLGKGKRSILMVGAHHGREWLTSALLMVMLEQYAKNYHSRAQFGRIPTSIFDEISIWFVPMLNPDGVTIQQQGLQAISVGKYDQLFEMNGYSPDFSKWKANGRGVDLNRQYPEGWNKLKDMAPIPWYQLYKGKKPQQESEVKAITDFTKQLNPLIAVSYHSSGREIFWNYKNGGHVDRDRKLAKKISVITGYSLGTPLKNAIGAGFTDWFITTFHQPGMTIEISPLVGETNPPLSIFTEEWKRNKLVGIMLANEAMKMKIQ